MAMMPQAMPQEMGDDDVAPAAQILPVMALLAQQQQGALNAQQQQEDMLKEAMKQQILRLISMIPTKNPAGIAARTEPMPSSISADDASMEDSGNDQEDYDVTGMDSGYGYEGA